MAEKKITKKRVSKKEREEKSKIQKEIEEKTKKQKELEEKNKKKAVNRFVFMMTFVSLTGFFGIAMRTLFERNIDAYVEICWLVFLGIGLIWESNLKEIFGISKTGMRPDTFGKIVTLVVGVLAVVTGVLILPQIGWRTPALLAIQGVISMVAIVFILVQRFLLNEIDSS